MSLLLSQVNVSIPGLATITIWIVNSTCL